MVEEGRRRRSWRRGIASLLLVTHWIFMYTRDWAVVGTPFELWGFPMGKGDVGRRRCVCMWGASISPDSYFSVTQ